MPVADCNLDLVMKQWLNCHTYEREHVRIIIGDCVLVCDLQECLISPVTAADSAQGYILY